MSTKAFQCPQCGKQYGIAGALKTHMKSHKKPEPKSGSLLMFLKRTPAESKKKAKPSIELKPLKKMRQLRLRKKVKPALTVVSNPAAPRPPRLPRGSKQEPIDSSAFIAPFELVAPDLNQKSPHFRIAHFSAR